MSNRIAWITIAAYAMLMIAASVEGTPANSFFQRFGQQPAAPVKLNPEASKQYLSIEAQQREVVRQANETLQQLEREKAALLIGANVPRADLAKVECTADAGGIVNCKLPAAAQKAEGSGQKAADKSP